MRTASSLGSEDSLEPLGGRGFITGPIGELDDANALTFAPSWAFLCHGIFRRGLGLPTPVKVISLRDVSLYYFMSEATII